MNATVDMIAGIQDTDRQIVSIFSRTDPTEKENSSSHGAR